MFYMMYRPFVHEMDHLCRIELLACDSSGAVHDARSWLLTSCIPTSWGACMPQINLAYPAIFTGRTSRLRSLPFSFTFTWLLARSCIIHTCREAFAFPDFGLHTFNYKRVRCHARVEVTENVISQRAMFASMVVGTCRYI